MLEVGIAGGLKAIGALLFGLLLVAVVRLFSGSTADGLEKALHLPSMTKPTEREVPTAPVAGSSEASPLAYETDDPEAVKLAALRDLLQYAEHTDDVQTVRAAIDTELAAGNADLLSDGDLSSGRGTPLKK